MVDDLHRKLTSIGLSEKEARVFLALLSLGAGTIQDISEQSGVNRATTYLLVDSLRNRGLISVSQEEKRTVYVAEKPRKLMELVEAEVKTAQEKREEADQIIPELEALFRSADLKPVVRYYEGEMGIQSLRELIAETKSDRCDSFTRLNENMRTISATDLELRHRCFQGKASFRFLYTRDLDIPVPEFPDALKGNINIRFTENRFMDFDGEIGMLDSMVYFASMRPRMMGCIVSSTDIAKLFHAMFEAAWASARE